MTGYNIKKKPIKDGSSIIVTLDMMKYMVEWLDKKGTNRSKVIRDIIKKEMEAEYK